MLKEISLEYSLEGLMLKLKPQSFGTWCEELTHWKRWWEKLKAGEGDNKGWEGRIASPTQWTWVRANSGRWWRTGKLACCSPWGGKESNMTEWLSNNSVHLKTYIFKDIYSSILFKSQQFKTAQVAINSRIDTWLVVKVKSVSRSVMSNFLRPYGL